MEKTHFESIKLIGLSLPSKTTNENGQSNRDCGNLWQQFESRAYFSKIPDKLGHEIYAVYYQYEGDYTNPFSYFIGCKVKPDAEVPVGMDHLTISGGTYQKITAKGKMPDCVANAWRALWEADIPRAYRTDFEVYDERSNNWNGAEVDIFISV